MYKIISTVFFILFLSFNLAADQNDKVLEFGENLKNIIAKSDQESFKSIQCLPENNYDCSSNSYALKAIFADDKNSDFEKIMRTADLEIKIYGPLTIEEEYKDQSYVLVFYSPSNSPFGQNGYVSDEVGQRELYKSFLQTIVTLSDGVVYFHRTVFYIGRHHPYVEDYGI